MLAVHILNDAHADFLSVIFWYAVVVWLMVLGLCDVNKVILCLAQY